MARTWVLMVAVATSAAVDVVTADARPPTAAVCGRPVPAKARGIRAVDWCNGDVGGMKGRLRDGHADLHLYHDLGQPHDSVLTRLRSVDHADLDGDGRPEAFLVLEETMWFHGGGTSRSSTSSDLVVFALRGGKPVRLGSIATGTPVHDLTVRRGVVTLVSGPDAARTRHRWDARGDDFVELPPRRP